MNFIAAQAVDTSGTLTRTYFELSRLQSMTQWWHWMALLGAVGAIAVYVSLLYRRDTAELPRGTRWLLVLLRLTALAGILIFFFGLEKQTERKLVKPSRVAVLVDTSQSMGLADDPNVGPTASGGQSRLQQIIERFSQGQLLDNLRQKHQVTVFRFGQGARPEAVATFPKITPLADPGAMAKSQSWADLMPRLRVLYGIGLSVAAVAFLAFFVHALAGRFFRGKEGEAWLVLVGGVSLLMGVVWVGVVHVRYPQIGPLAALRGEPPEKPEQPASNVATTPSESEVAKPREPDPKDVQWESLLAAKDAETRLGAAVRWIVEQERGGPLAGVVLLTDGRNNAGVDPELVVGDAEAARIPLYPIGIGSDRMPRNARVVDVEAPPRVYPGDDFTLTAFVQGTGLDGRSVRVQLLTEKLNEDGEADPAAPLDIQEESRVDFQRDGQIVSVPFQITPDAIGRRRWVVQVVPPGPGDVDPRDDTKDVEIEVVEQKNRVLLLAGGPMREYRFVRNLLYRDKNTTVDVLLQSAPVGAAQEADTVLDEFPMLAEDMFQYDCLVAFDPDWRELGLRQVQLLDQWVAEKAGGLVLIAGPVQTPNWTRVRPGSVRDAGIDIVRGLYPVVFYTRGGTIHLGRHSSDTPWPLRFTPEGRDAKFLWLEDSPTGSEQAWSDFEGVYGYQALRDVKAGTKVYARFSDPDAAIDDELPVYMAGQFYGAGRVFYMGSGEMWRLRALDEAYFERFYTQLIRHVSQGRLLRDSSRGVLLVDRPRTTLGQPVQVRATLSDAQYRPLSVDEVSASLLKPDGDRQPLVLRRMKQAPREGTYAGQFTATLEGDYRIDLAIPGVADELLTQQIRVRIPTLEIEQPQRNDPLLSQLAQRSGGTYYVGLDAAIGKGGAVPLTNRLPARDQESYLPSTTDRQFQETLRRWLLVLICGALSLEWFIRRLNKLA